MSLKAMFSDIKSTDIKIDGKYIFFKEKKYKENDWLKKINSFSSISEKQIILRNKDINELSSTIWTFFERNVSKISFLGLIFPCILFLVISLISLTLFLFLQHEPNFENFAKIQILFSLLYFLLSVILFFKIINGEKVYITRENFQTRFKHLSKKEYNYYKKCFEKCIENEHYFFESIVCNVNGKEYKLREFNFGDEKGVFDIFKSEKVFKYLLGNPLKDEDEANLFIYNCINDYKNHKIYKLAIEIDGKLIGYIGLSKMDLSKTTCQIVYAIGEGYWGNGFVATAISIFIPYLKKIGMETIFAGHVQENINSGKVLLKSNFVRFEEKDYVLNIHGEDKQIISYIYNERNE